MTRADTDAPQIRAVLHIHAYYLEGLDEVLQILLSNNARPDLVVTGAEENRAAVLQALAAYPGQSRFVPCGNIGRDILPFLALLPELTARYQLIGHIHLKRSAWVAQSDFAKHWLRYLLSATIGNLEQGLRSVDDILADVAARQGAVAIYLPHMPSPIGWSKNRALAAPIFAELSRAPLPEQFLFSAGTMFWAGAEYLRRFSQIDLPWEELVPEPIDQDGTVLHAIERLFGAVAYAERLPIVILPPDLTPFVMSLRLARQITPLTQS